MADDKVDGAHGAPASGPAEISQTLPPPIKPTETSTPLTPPPVSPTPPSPAAQPSPASPPSPPASPSSLPGNANQSPTTSVPPPTNQGPPPASVPSLTPEDGVMTQRHATARRQPADVTSSPFDIAAAETDRSVSVDVNENQSPIDSGTTEGKGVSQAKVPQAMWEDGILTGYRRPDKPWDYYARSVLWMHNETVYIWGLVLSTILFGICHWRITGSSSLVKFDHSARALLVAMKSAYFYCLGVAIAHALRHKSVTVDHVTKCVEDALLTVFVYGQITMYYHCSGTKGFYQTVRTFYPQLLFVLAVSILICRLIGRKYYAEGSRKEKALQLAPLVACAVLGVLPVLVARSYHCLNSGKCTGDAGFLVEAFLGFIVVPLTFAMSVMRFPESRYRGSVDLWGQSRQCVHLVVTLGLCAAFFACYWDMQEKPRFERLQITNRRRQVPQDADSSSIEFSFLLFISACLFALSIPLGQFLYKKKKKL